MRNSDTVIGRICSRPHNMFFFFNDTATTEIYTLSLHDALPILSETNTKKEMAKKRQEYFKAGVRLVWEVDPQTRTVAVYKSRSEEHTSELQSRQYLVCRLLLEKKNQALYANTPRLYHLLSLDTS